MSDERSANDGDDLSEALVRVLMPFAGGEAHARELLVAIERAEASALRSLSDPMPCEDVPMVLAGSICEVCFDAPATSLAPAPYGGEMGVCGKCVPQ